MANNSRQTTDWEATKKCRLKLALANEVQKNSPASGSTDCEAAKKWTLELAMANQSQMCLLFCHCVIVSVHVCICAAAQHDDETHVFVWYFGANTIYFMWHILFLDSQNGKQMTKYAWVEADH